MAGNPGKRLRQAGGFTLLEVLVVLAIIAAVSALVGPAGWRMLTSASLRGAQADVHATLAGLPMSAFTSGRALVLNDVALTERLPPLPADCRVLIPTSIPYAANGMTPGGVVQLACAGTVANYRVDAVTGAVHREERELR